MDIRKVKKLIEMMEESDIQEIEIKEGEESVRISRGGAVIPSLSAPAAAPVSAAPAPAPSAAPSPASSPVPVGGNVIFAPMVGTFYRAASPGSPPYVNVGDHVKAGDTLCIIESMKMMNEIKSEFTGQVEAILVNNEEAVEFDQPLFTIS